MTDRDTFAASKLAECHVFFDGDDCAGGLIQAAAVAEIERLREAIRRLADQDATLSVQGGSLTVMMDATLTAKERKAVAFAADHFGAFKNQAATLRSLLERLK